MEAFQRPSHRILVFSIGYYATALNHGQFRLSSEIRFLADAWKTGGKLAENWRKNRSSRQKRSSLNRSADSEEAVRRDNIHDVTFPSFARHSFTVCHHFSMHYRQRITNRCYEMTVYIRSTDVVASSFTRVCHKRSHTSLAPSGSQSPGRDVSPGSRASVYRSTRELPIGR